MHNIKLAYQSFIINNVKSAYKSFVVDENGDVPELTWLKGRSYSDAFVICVGAGPWKIGRRKFIQQQALDKLNGRDLRDLKLSEIDNFYPLKWQNDFLKNIIINRLTKSSEDDNLSFNEYCLRFKNLINYDISLFYRNQFYKDCGCPKGAKVLSLFLRDSIKFEYCFPIDRHVKRYLQRRGFYLDEDRMINLCLKNSISPRKFAIGIARSMQIDNPDWSI